MIVPAPDRNVERLHPEAKRRFLALAEACLDLGCPIFLTEGYRSPERQDALYAQGRTAPGPKVTNAKAWQSWHQTGRAVDFAFRSPDPFGEKHPWELVARMGEHLGFEWGGRWRTPDRPHFQWTGGLSLAEAVEEAKRTKRG